MFTSRDRKGPSEHNLSFDNIQRRILWPLGFHEHWRPQTVIVATVRSEVSCRVHLWSSHRQTPMTLEDKIKATAKDAEGRLQAAAGEITGNEQMQTEGEAKQVQAQLIDAAGTVKDKVQQVASSVGEALDGLTGKGN